MEADGPRVTVGAAAVAAVDAALEAAVVVAGAFLPSTNIAATPAATASTRTPMISGRGEPFFRTGVSGDSAAGP